MITVADLEFDTHPAGMGGTQAVVQFENGYGASVITGRIFYTRPDLPYEIAVLDANGSITYDTPITDDVCGYLSLEDADDILRQIQELPRPKGEGS